MSCPHSGLTSQSARYVSDELTQQVQDPVGALHDDVGALDQRALLVGGGADEQRREAMVAKVLDGRERLDVAEVVAGEEETSGVLIARQVADDGPLVHARRARLNPFATRPAPHLVTGRQVAQPWLEPL